jgi:hypothetical protein
LLVCYRMEEPNPTTLNTTKPIISTKEELIMNIKEWIKTDSEIERLKNEIKEKKAKKKQITDVLINVMKSNSLDQIDINDGALAYKKRKTRKTVSGKFLLAQLEEYYKDQPELAKQLAKIVLDNREEVIKEDIKLKMNNKN